MWKPDLLLVTGVNKYCKYIILLLIAIVTYKLTKVASDLNSVYIMQVECLNAHHLDCKRAIRDR